MLEHVMILKSEILRFKKRWTKALIFKLDFYVFRTACHHLVRQIPLKFHLWRLRDVLKGLHMYSRCISHVLFVFYKI